MKKNACGLGLLVIVGGLAAHAGAATVTVSIHNITGTAGVVRGSLCNKETFLKTCAMTASEKPTAATLTLQLKDVAPGKYAFSAYHDENSNSRMDRNVFGIPTEGYAFSREAKGRRGPPAFDDAVFEVTEGSHALAVTLNY